MIGHLVIPLATLSHQSLEVHGPDAAVFDGFRWVDKNLPAAMVSLGYFPFGLNRWACPGRVLAVAGESIRLPSISPLTSAYVRQQKSR